jgi:hypothetical protein
MITDERCPVLYASLEFPSLSSAIPSLPGTSTHSTVGPTLVGSWNTGTRSTQLGAKKKNAQTGHQASSSRGGLKSIAPPLPLPGDPYHRAYYSMPRTVSGTSTVPGTRYWVLVLTSTLLLHEPYTVIQNLVKYTKIVNVVLRHIKCRTFTRASLEFHEQSKC